VNPAFFEDLLQGVYLDMITWVFSGAGFEGAPAFSLSQWVEFARSKGFEPDRLRGQITWRPTEQERPDWRYTADLIDWARDHAPGFRILQVAAVTAEPTVSLSQMVADAHTCFAQLTKMSLPAHEVARQIGFSVRIGPDYFLEIARLRALQVLWYNLLKAWGAPPTQPAISVEYDPAAYTDEVYANMVRATTMAMSAVFGGADHITVLPYDEGREQLSGRSAAFARRIARNVQHLLKMESYLDTGADPAAGSYYIEQLTSKLAEAAWSRQ
ncbi:MAG: hypothetical protein IT434_18845, partial [Phycisphaerales bacterium]|nr:hypothetical protein [Phycisphaerales bacterium]